jgi:hypothetical protein
MILFICKRLALAALIFLNTAIYVSARDIKISVIDGDLEEPLAGAVLRLPDGTEVKTDDEGNAAFFVPDETSGEIRVAYPGYETNRLMLRLGGANDFVVSMRMGAETLENKELVIEETMPAASDTRSGRSVSLAREELTLTAEIGIIEDIMSSIKLLPGVGYTGLFNAQPSIRGGEPGDMKAALDGFYIDSPYHWGGGYSIFDPKTIENAQLYHGVFSARYSHTISGLLELSSRRIGSENAGFSLNLSTSAAGFSVSHPLPDFSSFSGANRGAVMLIGKITYWDPFVYLAKGLSKVIEDLAPVNVVSTAPYIRSLNLLSNYRFSDDMELNLNGYVGGDGIGVLYNNTSDRIDLLSNSELKFEWNNLICFLTANLLFNPRPDMMIKSNLGVSYNSELMDADINYDIAGNSSLNSHMVRDYKSSTLGSQARFDFDWDLKNGFLFSAGIEELYRRWFESIRTNSSIDVENPPGSNKYMSFPRIFPDVENNGFFSGLYSLLEYKDPAGRFAAEAGLRLDHLYFIGNNFTLQTMPAFNPRLNFDYYLLRNKGFIDLLTVTAGVGLFSSMNDGIAYIDRSYGLNDFDLKQNRSITSIAGTKIDFLKNWIFTLEFYYKYVFDRAYSVNIADEEMAVVRYNFDGEGHIWGFDIMLQKIEGRLIDGWISYSFNYAYYHDPKSIEAFIGASFEDRTNNWYYPQFHRFSNLNLVLNFKPMQRFNIYTRFGFASGVPKSRYGNVIPYKIMEGGKMVTKYKRTSTYSDTERSSISLPMDIKLSWFFPYPNNKVQTEVYLAIENALSLIYRPKGNTTLNPYTGEEEEGGSGASFELPIPMVSFGFKWTY